MELTNYKIVLKSYLETKLLFKKYKFNDYGSMSTIYIYSEKELLKIYKHSIEESKYMLDLLKSLNIDNFSNPLLYVYVKKYLFGFTMPIKKGTMFSRINKNLNISLLLDSIKNINSIISKVSNNNIVMCDLNSNNLLLDDKNKQINFVDIDSYYIDNRISKDELYISNNICFIDSIISCLLNIYNNSYNGYSFKVRDELESFYINKIESGLCINDVLKEIINYLNNLADREIENISDFRINLEIISKKLTL